MYEELKISIDSLVPSISVRSDSNFQGMRTLQLPLLHPWIKFPSPDG
jgi:hypothetical protein